MHPSECLSTASSLVLVLTLASWLDRQMHWFRSRAPVKKDSAFQKASLTSSATRDDTDASDLQCVLAYASDMSFIGTAARAMGLGARTEPHLGMLASLDHAMYFYDTEEFSTDDWMLFYMECPVVSGGRGLVRGQIYTRSGELVTAVVSRVSLWALGESA